MAVIKQGNSRYGWVKIEEGPGSWWTLWVGNDIKAQSADHDYIIKMYDSYVS